MVSYRPAKPSARLARALLPRSEQLHDMLVFRRVVEPGACHIAASRALSPEQPDLLLTAHDEVAGSTDHAEHRQADSRFHLTLATLTGSARVVEAVTSVQSTLHEMLLAIPVLEANIAHSDRQHAALVRAVLAGKPDLGRRTMEHDLAERLGPPKLTVENIEDAEVVEEPAQNGLPSPSGQVPAAFVPTLPDPERYE